jgi:hypothetical protein
MLSSNLKDIGLQLNDHSMFEMINYKNSNLHPILQAAITLVFFTMDETFRSEYDGIYHLIGQANNNIMADIELDLSQMSFTLNKALKETYPEVLKTEFETSVDGSHLYVTLTVTTSEDTLSTVIYTRNLD